MAGPRTLKRIQYQQTQDLLQGINAQDQLPPDQTIQSSSFTALHKLRTDFNQRALMRSHLETLIEVLAEHEKQTGIPDSLKTDYSRLLNRINLDPGKVSLSEFEEAIKRFSSNHEYTLALQDEINNKKLDLEVNPEEAEEPGQPSGAADSSESDQEGDQMPGQEPGGQEESSPGGQRRQQPSRQPPRTPTRTPPPTQEEEDEAGKPEENQPEATQEQPEQQPSQQNQPGQSQQPGARDARQTKSDDTKTKPETEKPKQGFREKFNNRRKKAAAFLRRSPTSSGGLLNQIAQHFFDKWLAQLARGAMRLAGQLGRMALNALAQGAANLLSRLAVQGALTGARLLVVAVVANPITWVVVGLSTALFGFFWYVSDINRECGQPGVIELTKSANKETFQLGETIEYKINVVYKIRCRTAYAAATVRDRIPANTTYVPDSAKSSFPYGFINITGPKGILDGNTLIWKLDYLGPDEPNTLTFSVTPNQTGIWIANQATLTYQTGALGPGGKIIDSQSRSFQETVNKAAEMNGMPPALMKAILAVEAPQSLRYSEEEFLKFSRPGWWEGLESNADTLEGNHPDAIRGYAYNTCAYRSCAAGADVRGVAQFELRTWQGVAPKLKFTDSHDPDRRNATDSIFGSALHNRENAEIYTGSSTIEWTEDVVRAMARVYCAGPSAARDPSKVKDPACGGNYDDLVWDRYRQFLEQP